MYLPKSVMATTVAVLLGAAPALAATETVTINNYTFTPATLTVHPGDTVIWTNQDSIPHTATALDGKSFDSGAIDPGDKLEIRVYQGRSLQLSLRHPPGYARRYRRPVMS